MQIFVRGECTMIAAAVQRGVDGIPKRPHSRKCTGDDRGVQCSPIDPELSRAPDKARGTRGATAAPAATTCQTATSWRSHSTRV